MKILNQIRYEDDEDNGDEIVYTGCGGFDEKKVQFKGI